MNDTTLKVYSDGGARGNPGPAAAAYLVIKKGKTIKEDAVYIGKATNNVAEYQGIISAVKWLVNNQRILEDVIRIEFYLDSLLVVQQLNGNYKVKNEKIKKLYYELMKNLEEIKCPKKFIHVPRDQNLRADSLVNMSLNENMR